MRTTLLANAPITKRAALANAWPLARRRDFVGSKALDAAGPGISVGTSATGGGTLALMTGAAAASATGIGLVVVGSLATPGAAAKSVVATRSGYKHRDSLSLIGTRWREFPCSGLPSIS